MKRFCVTVIMWCILFTAAFGQTVNGDTELTVRKIDPYFLWVSLNQTSNLIFPYAIKSVDRGSGAVMVQKAKGAENVLQVKAAVADFLQTNLSVITEDGRLYSFLLRYAIEPSVLNLRFYKLGEENQNVLIKGMEHNKEFYDLACSEVKDNRGFLRKHITEQMVVLSLQSIYMRGNTMFFKLSIRNNSSIIYSPDYIKFIVKDRKKARKTAIQEKVLSPVYSTNQDAVNGDSSGSIVLAFPSFTIPKNQNLIIQVGERSGGRTLLLKIKYKVLLKARNLSF
ncbi:conjugative transposon protein TraN [Chitinophaga pendula]|uniref:conjugative transposon protein TraN n=1 Tax=Chitinophaga TaxID=79328 RepID=UPI000BAF2BE0|nr:MULTISPECIES: conjugative transposon protein TraN [Chitinophaga]ASZ13716.1 conjugative transposon protein TraN [Chitinophaga sp. MD30]UCJ08666.1 conjugative transposon protein TraN [Chitinophaga pendula]